jgi:hypothetical protein
MSTELSPEQVRGQIKVLRSLFDEARKQYQEVERTGQRIDREIKALQGQCPHKNSKNELVGDVAEIKLVRFCTDCGAQC